MRPEATSQVSSTHDQRSDATDLSRYDTSVESQTSSTGSILSEPSDASDPSEDYPSVDSQILDTGGIDGQLRGYSQGCEECGSLICVCDDIEGENRKIINTFLLSGQPLTIEAWSDNVNPLSTQDIMPVVQDPVPAHEDKDIDQKESITADAGKARLPSDSDSELFWKFYDQDPLWFQENLPAYWANKLKYYLNKPLAALAVPGSWLCNDAEKSTSLDTSVTSMKYAHELFIKSVMTYGYDTSFSRVKIAKPVNAVDVSYKHVVRPKPMLIINDLPPNHPQSIRLAILALFAYPCPLSYERRLIDVMVPSLSGLFYVPGCRVSHSFPQTDDALFEDVIESRVIIEGLPETHWPSLIVAMPWDARPLQDGSASLTKYFERSLRILTTLYSETPNPTVLPPWCVLIGIVYAATGFRVYGHYPLWNEDTDRWEYISVALCDTHDGSFTESYIRDLCSVAYALLSIQRHAHELQIQLRRSIGEHGQILQTLTM